MVCGLPDLRLEYPDPTVSWAEDVAAARDLAGRVEAESLELLNRRNWQVANRAETLVERFVNIDRGSVARSDEYLDAIESARGRPLGPADRVLEVGCGSGALAVAAARRGCHVSATDLALRWLVVARKRLEDAGRRDVALACCAAESLPFPPESFDVVIAGDVIEHTANARAFVAGCARVVKPGGMLFLATPNRFSLGLEPHVRLWGVGWLPRAFARRYVRRARGSTYDDVQLLSARRLRALLATEGLEATIVPPPISSPSEALYEGVELRLVKGYNRVRRLTGARSILLAVGPFFHVFATKPGSAASGALQPQSRHTPVV